MTVRLDQSHKQISTLFLVMVKTVRNTCWYPSFKYFFNEHFPLYPGKYICSPSLRVGCWFLANKSYPFAVIFTLLHLWKITLLIIVRCQLFSYLVCNIYDRLS